MVATRARAEAQIQEMVATDFHGDWVVRDGTLVTESSPAVGATVPHLRNAVVAYAAEAGAGAALRDAVALAVSEAVSNVVRHAYRGREGAVHLTAAVVEDELWVLVADDGCGHQTPAEHPGLGWGLALIADATDEFVITERATGGTEARMRFRLPAAGGSGSV